MILGYKNKIDFHNKTVTKLMNKLYSPDNTGFTLCYNVIVPTYRFKLQHTQHVLFSKQQDFKLHTYTKSCGGSKKTQNVKEMDKKMKQEIKYGHQDQMSSYDQTLFQ